MVPLLLGGLVGAFGLFVLARGFGILRSNPDSLEERLRAYEEHPQSLQEMELSAPFKERMLLPLWERMRDFLSDRTSDNSRQAMQEKLSLAGRPGNLSPADFQGIRYAGTIVMFIVGLLLGALLANPVFIAVFAAVGAAIGFYGPYYWLKSRVDKRRKKISLALADALDLLTISVEAGLSFDAALSKLISKFDNALTEEFAQVQKEVRLGRPRAEAMDDMGRRSGVEDVHNFVQAVIQSEQLGVGVSKILRLQSDEIRRKRRQKAQEKAAQAALKMMLPMVGCIFPTIWIALLGPAILILFKVSH